MVLSSCCTSNQIPLSSYRLVSQPNCHVCISSAPCRWNLPALTSPTYSKTEIVKIKLLRLTITGRMFDRFKNILFLSYHRLSRLSPKKCKATTTLRVNYVRLFINNNIHQFIVNHYRFFDTQQFFYSFRKLFCIFQFIKHCLLHFKYLVAKYNINGDARNRTEKLEKHRRENHFTPVTAM